MWFALATAVTLPALASAHGVHGVQHHARASDIADAVASATAAVASGASALPSLTFSLASVNPTALPLSSIVATAPTQATIALSSTYVAGSKPTNIPGAPGMPAAYTINPKDYPTLDKTPPTDTDLVQQWIQEVQDSGISIPDIPVTNLGGCANNTEAAANTSRCWWTCGGCTRDTDISTCPTKNTWGLTYDDGPGPWTPDLLQYLEQHDMHSTFFVIGSRAISRPAMLQDEYMAGHQIAVHTWSHPYMTTKTNEEVIAELGWTKKVIKDTIGVTPLYWRPPYGDIDDRVRAISRAMNLIPIMWTRMDAEQTFDTQDYDIPAGEVTSTQVLNNWQEIMNNSSSIDTGFIVLEHDLWQQTVDIAVGYILPEALAHQPKFNITPVIECQDMPLSNSYIETNDNSTNPPPVLDYKASASGSASVSVSASASAAQGSSTSGVSVNSAAGASSGAPAMAVVSQGMVTAALSAIAAAGAFLL
ncbi:carbohydrate esterase family 4 protein [Wolfiporia cocos MD-104 SS10]|uniref:chitin deacetylase n=1 Tax=Wolfiporia cocos (strain MD-104) TaxID=742152 RepID=A0A2H3IV93_WOLCO|nr:carbohydrate esterase family 4 protein [Wolfiporia cocos MD-104 SS10]